MTAHIIPFRKRFSDPRGWRAPLSIEINESVLLRLGDSIPELPYLIVGTRISGAEAAELGWTEFSEHGGWLIWSEAGDDFDVIDLSQAHRCIPLTALGFGEEETTA